MPAPLTPWRSPGCPARTRPRVPEVRVRRVWPMACRMSPVVTCSSPALEQDALEGQLRGPARGELDVGRGEQPRFLHDRGHVQLAVRDRGQVAVPDRLPRGRVGRPDRDHVVEPAVPQERAVQGADRVRGADQQPLVLLPERRDELEHLVGDPLGCGHGARLARPGDLLHLVDEQHNLVQLGDQARTPPAARRPGRPGTPRPAGTGTAPRTASPAGTRRPWRRSSCPFPAARTARWPGAAPGPAARPGPAAPAAR